MIEKSWPPTPKPTPTAVKWLREDQHYGVCGLYSKPDTPKMWANGGATIYTTPNFGCVQFERREG